MLGSMRSTPSLFKVLTNFSIEEFDELYHIVCPTISAHARSTGDIRILPGRPSKLNPEQRLLGFLLYMKHDPTTTLPGFLWNWSKSCVIDDQILLRVLSIGLYGIRLSGLLCKRGKPSHP